jgi:uncharacterized protein
MGQTSSLGVDNVGQLANTHVDATTKAVAWLYDTITGIVDKPEEVSVTRKCADAGTNFQVHLHDTDLGKVIGKQGRTARSLRTLLMARGRSSGSVYTLDIGESGKQARA